MRAIKLLTSMQFIVLSKAVTVRGRALFCSVSRGNHLRMSANQVKPLLSGAEAVSLSTSQSVRFVDGSWHMNKSRIGRNEYLESRIPNAQFFDVDLISDKTSSLPHMLPGCEDFEKHIESMGISSDDYIIVYVKPDCFSGPRVWWTFRAFGHEKVSLIDGGLNAWIKAGGMLETSDLKPPLPPNGKFKAKFLPSLVVDSKAVLKAVENGSSQILDARSAARFLGQAPEPRAGLRGGHIPGSLSLPFTAFTEKDDVTKFKNIDDIKNVFDDTGVVMGSRVITSCGSGVTAAVLTLGHYMIFKDLNYAPIYDGSWSEWGQADRPEFPVINPAATTVMDNVANK